MAAAQPQLEAPLLRVETSEGQLLEIISLPEGGHWCLAWEHSVAGFTVKDCFRSLEGQLLLESSLQPDFAAGLGHTPGKGQLTTSNQGGYLIQEINQPVPGQQLRLRVGSPQVNHRIEYGKQELALYPLVGQARVVLRLTTE